MSHIMTQRFPGSGNQRFISGRASSAYTPLGPDDPEIIEEAKVLLAQFIKHSTQGARASSARETNRTNGTSHDRAGRRTAASPSAPSEGLAVVNGRQAMCAKPEGQEPTGASTKKPGPSQTHETARAPLHRQTRGCEPGSSAEPHAKDAPPALRKRASPTMSTRARRTPNLTSRENSPGSDMVQPTGIRRSRRSRTGPANYYQIPAIAKLERDNDHDYQEEDEEEEGTRSCQPARLASRLRRRDTSTPLCTLEPVKSSPAVRATGARSTRDSIVYSSRTAQIIKSPFIAGEAEKRLTRWPYLPGRKTVESLKRLSRDSLQTGIILHVDFDHQETTALLALLSFYGVQPPSQPDTVLADCVIQALSSPKIPSNLSKKLSRLCRLSRAAVEDGVTDTKAWLTKNLISGNNKRSQKVRRLLCKALKINTEGQEFTMPDGQLHPDIADKIYKLSGCLHHAFHLIKRERTDVEAFLADARSENVPTAPYVFRIVQPPSQSSSTRKTTSRHGLSDLIRQRELGGRALREIQSNTAKNLKLTRTWKGASNDVIVAAWSPDGTRFAAGATAQCDEHNMEYNRGNNLVWGDLTTNVLTELPDHYIPRPTGRNSVSRTVNDARLFMSVSSMEWYEDALFTASYDNTVKLWDFPNHTARCFKTLRHDSKVEVMARSKFASNLLATGTNSIGLWQIRESRYHPLGLSGLRSQKELIPTSLAWGAIPATQNILLAGLSEKEEGVSRNGFLAAWHVGQASVTPMHLLPNSQNIFDIKWHPTLPLFATASAASLGAPRTHRDTRSVVRLYQPFPAEMRMRRTIEFECPALDINDVAICPSSSNYVTASCTDGVTYVWDSRQPDQILHRLRHGAPLNQIDELIDREQADVGVRMAIWGAGTDQFYTGASDGVLKLWDITRSPEDVLVQDVANLQEEIMSGAFSTDKSNLLIGDAAGGIHLLSSGPFSQDEKRSFQFKRAQVSEEDQSSAETGVAISREYTSTGRLVRHPIFGYGKGPNYDGPFASWARPAGTPSHELAATPLNEESQIRQFDGPPLPYRTGLSAAERAEFERRVQLCRIRNQRRNVHKRKRECEGVRLKRDPDGPSSSKIVDLCSDDEVDAEETKPRIARAQYTPMQYQDIEVIDLTGDTDSETVEAADVVKVAVSERKIHLDELASLLEALEEDYWWPDNKDIDANLDDVD
ncbi:WD40-repeat-containing domain protein [Aspergillus floccosus]